MRLLNKITLNLLSISLFVFLVGMVFFYFILRQQVDRNINLELEKRKQNLTQTFDAAHSSVGQIINLSDTILVTRITHPRPSERFSDTLLFNPKEKKYELFRELGFVQRIKERDFYIQIFKPLEETDRLIIRIILIMTMLIILIILSLIIVNRYSSRQDWKAFYDTLSKINNYDVNSHESFSLVTSDIKEFEDLNRVLSVMTDRIKNDYLNLKEYIENASHEIQTPLAIINSKMEILLQSGELQEKQLKAVGDAYDASHRLSRLNKTLILLAKIENRQFPDSSAVFPYNVIVQQLENLEDLIESKEINVVLEADKEASVKMNPYLAEILFVNLVKNAIRHNIPNGDLLITLTSKKLEIANSGLELQMDPKTIFKRFQTSSSSLESLGLGLSLVQKICDLYGFKVNYDYKEGMHFMQVVFA